MAYRRDLLIYLLPLLAGIFILVSVTSCSSDITLDLDFSQGPEIEINSIIIDGHRASVTVNRVSTNFIGNLDNALPEAELTLFENGLPISRFELDTNQGFVASRTRSKFISYQPVNLRPGSAYHFECSAEGLPTAISALHVFEQLFTVDSVCNPLDILGENRDEFLSLVDFNVTGFFPDLPDNISASVGFNLDTNRLEGFGAPPDFLNPLLGPSFILQPNVSEATRVTFLYNTTNFGQNRSRGERENIVLFRFVRFPSAYQQLTDAIFTSGGALGEIGTINDSFESPPSNARVGFGSFYLAEAYMLAYPLPPQ